MTARHDQCCAKCASSTATNPCIVALTVSASQSMEAVHGKKYIVDGELENPAGKEAWVRSIWIIDAGTDFPRLVTAYPLGKWRRDDQGTRASGVN